MVQIFLDKEAPNRFNGLLQPQLRLHISIKPLFPPSVTSPWRPVAFTEDELISADIRSNTAGFVNEHGETESIIDKNENCTVSPLMKVFRQGIT